MAKSVEQLQKELEAAEAKAKRIKDRIKDQERTAKAQEAKKERAQDNRRRYCLGGHILKLLRENSNQSFTASEILEGCKAELTRNVDRVAFGLDPLPTKAKAQADE